VILGRESDPQMKKQYSYLKSAMFALRGTAAVMSALAMVQSHAQLNIAAANTAYNINFDGTLAGVGNGVWAGNGFQPAPTAGRLDSDAWQVTDWSNGNLPYGGTRITSGTDYRRGVAVAPIAVGGMYAFDDGVGGTLNGRALGFQPGSSDWAPGSLTLRVQNNTGSTLTAFDIAYNVYYRDDQGRSSDFNLYVSTDNVSYTHISSQDVVSPVGPAGIAWVANARSVTVNGYYVPNGQYFYIRWRGNDVAGSGSRDEFALDDISVTGRVYTLVRLTSSSSNADEDDGTATLTASIVNPHPTNPTTVDVALSSGDAARIDNYTTQTLVFPGGSIANQNLTINITDNGACDGDVVETFMLQNVTGGITPGIGSPDTHIMTIDDDETAPVSHAQNFDGGPGDDWPITLGGGNQSANTGAGDTPASQRILSASQSWQVNNGTATLELGAVDVQDWSSITLSAHLTSTSLNATNGADVPDSVAFYVDLDGAGFPLDPDISVSGNSNRRYGYGAPGVASTTAGTPVTYICNFGGNGIDYATVNITIPNGTNTVALRVIGKNNDANEVWNLDNIQVSGTLCSPIYYSRSNGSETTGTWSTSRTGAPAPGVVTFTKNATMVIQATHTVTSTSNATIDLRDLDVETGGTLDLAGNGTVSINGPSFNVDGTLTATDDAFNILGDALTTISGATSSIDVEDLTLDGFGAQVTTTNLRIFGTLQLDNGNFDANGKNVVLASTATGTGRLGPVDPAASYTGSIRMERYIPAGVTDWRLLCSPVQGRTVYDWTDDFYTAGFPGSYYPNFIVNGNPWPSVRMYDETVAGGSNAGLIGVSSTAEPLTPGRGFTAWSGATLTSTPAFTIDVRGVPVIANTPFSIPLSYTSTGNPGADGLNLVGNPLPSPIDFTDVTLTNVASNYYIYDPGASANVGWDEVTQIGTGGCNGNIQSSQGFWLTATAASPSATLDESAKVLEPINGGIFSDVQDHRPMVRLFLRDQDTSFTDEALVHFISGEPSMDARDMRKLVLEDAPNVISTVNGSEDLMINAMGELNDAIDIPVKVRVATSGDHSISFGSSAAIGGARCLVLEDLLTGNTVAVEDGSSMNFFIDASAPVDPPRFVLHVGRAVESSVVDVACAGNATGTISATGPGDGAWTWQLITPAEDMIQQGPVEGEVVFSDLPAGEYHLYVDGATGCGALSQDLHIDEPGSLAGSTTVTAASCPGAGNGGADLTVMGGTAPYSFTWTDGSTTEDLQNVQAGEYAVTITDGNNCQAEVSGIIVSAGAGPEASFEVSEAPLPMEDVFFFNSGDQGLAYTWDFGDGATSTEVEPVHQFATAGVYTITLTATDGTCSDVFAQDLLVGSTGMIAAANSAMIAWSEGQEFVVQWHLEGVGGILAEVLDASGRSLAQHTAQGGMGRITISTQELPAGVYLLRVKAGAEYRTFKLPVGR